jgi:hypothetical protein
MAAMMAVSLQQGKETTTARFTATDASEPEARDAKGDMIGATLLERESERRLW